MSNSTSYAEPVQQISSIAGCVYFFLTKVIQPRTMTMWISCIAQVLIAMVRLVHTW